MADEKKKNNDKSNAAKTIMENSDFAYLDLLDDNSPRVFPEYNAEARILKKQIDSPSVCNIAVVAKYGAGKSSVINTYLHNYRRTKRERKKKFVLGKPEHNGYTRITLSTFNNIAYDEAAIERSILQQLLYSRKKSQLPNSEIKRTNKTSKWKSVGVGLLLTAFLLFSILFAIEATGALLFGVGSEWGKFLFLGLATGTLFTIVFGLIHYRKLTRFKYKDFEADLRSDDDKEKPAYTTSLINKFVDEVLYFFDCVDMDLVIFEDLDRLPTTEIFAKLRELNTIINGSRKRDEKVTFLYAAKDDLFKTEEERAKFFEFILPVVPVINPVTTGEKLRELLGNLPEIMGLTEKFIKGVSIYIPDMRILKNTLNDYIIMYSKIFEDSDAKAGHLSKEKLFALSLYKNLYPHDYALLEKNSGLVRLVIDMDKLREQSVADNKAKIKAAKTRLDAIKADQLRSIKELKFLFAGQVLGFSYSQRYYGNEPLAKNIFDDDFSFVDCKYEHIMHPKHGSQNYYLALPSGTTDVISPNGMTYAERESIITEQSENGGNTTKALIASLERERQAIFGYSFAEVVAQQGVDVCFSKDLQEQYTRIYKLDLKEPYTQQKTDELFKRQVDAQIRYLRFLVVQDYIDERYIEYTSNYKAQLITAKDAQFVADVQIKKQDFDYIPDDIKSVVGRLDDEDFLQTAILNKRLLDSLELIRVLDGKEETNKYKNLLALLAKTTELKVFEAIRDYIATSDRGQCEAFLEALIPIRPTLCEELLIDGKLEREKTDILVACVFEFATDYAAQNSNNRLSDYIGEHEDYIGLLEVAGDEKAIAIIKAIKPTIKQLNGEVLDGAIQRYIITNNRYALTLQNLEVIFGIAETEDLSTDFYARHFGFVMASDKESVTKYIATNINKYASAVLLNEKVTFAREEHEQVEVLLKNDSIDIETRNTIIRKCNIQVVDIAEFDAGLYYTLLDEGKVQPTWENTIKAYSEIGYKDDGVEGYILNTVLTGGFEWDGDEDDEDSPLELFADILGNTLTTADSNGKVASTTAIVRILKTIDKQYSLSQFNIAELLKAFATTTGDYHGKDKMLDFNFAKAIELGRITYASDDIQRMNQLPHSRNAYLIKFEPEILAEFDTFFDCALPQQQQVYRNGRYVMEATAQPKTTTANSLIGVVIGAGGVSPQIKKTLIEKCLPIIDIKGYERGYAKFFTSENVVVPTRILWQFTSTTAVDEMDKQTMLWLSRDVIDANTEWAEYTAYFDAIGRDWEKVYKKKDKLKIRQNDGAERLLKALKAKGWLTYKRSNKIEEFFGGPTFTIEAV